MPISYLEGYAEKLGAPKQMTASDQREVLDFLRPLATSTEDPEEAQAACDLLRRLRSRPEVTFEAATAIDKLLENPPDPHPPPSRRKIETTEFQTPVQPSQWAQLPPPPPAQGFPSPPQPAVAPPAPAGGGAPWGTGAPPAHAGSGAPWSTGAFVALLLATVFLGGVVGIVAGLIGRSTPAKRTQANILLWTGVGVLALWILAAAMAGGATDTCDPAVEFC